ncbi:MAG: hypothetical protein K8R17_12905 [Methanosarcinales archaeon]|nr:hypothetical protein [Methanosarcinales archaeon]
MSIDEFRNSPENSSYFSEVASVPILHVYHVGFKIYGELIQNKYSPCVIG